MAYANVPQRIASLVSLPDGGVDHVLLDRLHDDYDLDRLYDLIEIDTVARSWRAARVANAKAVQDGG